MRPSKLPESARLPLAPNGSAVARAAKPASLVLWGACDSDSSGEVQYPRVGGSGRARRSPRPRRESQCTVIVDTCICWPRRVPLTVAVMSPPPFSFGFLDRSAPLALFRMASAAFRFPS